MICNIKKTFCLVRLGCMLALASVLMTACTKSDVTPKASPLFSEAIMRVAFEKINELWKNRLKDELTQTSINQSTQVDVVLSGNSGQAIVKGSVTRKRSSGSNSSTSYFSVNLDADFQQFETDQLWLDGNLRFYEFSSSRTSCTSSGYCASSSDDGLYYDSEIYEGNTTRKVPVTIRFEHGGKRYEDAILIDAERKYGRFRVEITNGAGETFSW